MTKYLLLSIFILCIIAGCEPGPPARPTPDPCLALHTLGLPECRPPTSYLPEAQPTGTEVPITLIQQEVSYRLQAIGALLEQEPLTQGNLYHATTAINAYNINISLEFQHWTLRTLLLSLEQATPEKNRSSLQKIRNGFEELGQLGPQNPFPETEPAAPQKVQAVRDLFNQIEAEWQFFLEQVK